jgi:hypothetical protein
MILMGKFDWCKPNWLERVTPHLNIEGAEFFEPAEARSEGQPEPLAGA